MPLIAIDPAQIDEACINHMHGNHLHGAVTPEGAELFPTAVLCIAKPDVDRGANPAVDAAAPADQKGRFAAAKRAEAAYGDRRQTSQFCAEMTPGTCSVDARETR